MTLNTLRFNNLVKTKRKISKKYLFLMFVFILSLICSFNNNVTFSQNETSSSTQELYDATYDAIEELDLSKLEDLLKNLNSDKLIIGDINDIIKSIVDGNFDIDANNLLSYCVEIIFVNLKSIVPLCIVIVLIAVLFRVISSFGSTMLKDGILDIINFVCIGIVVVLLGKYIVSINNMIIGSINSMQTVIDVVFPILLTLMTAIGATSSVAIYTPITTILNTVISNIITSMLYPIYLFSFALIVVSVISKRIKLDKFIDFTSSLFKTSIAFVFTIFSGIFVIKGISAGKYDSIGIYTTKFAVKNYIPIIGSYIAEGFNYVMLSSVLVKNAVGLAGIIIIMMTVLSPVVFLLIFKLALNLTSSICDMLGESTISSVLSKVSKITAFPIAIILGVAFMFIMSVSLVMCTANLI